MKSLLRDTCDRSECLIIDLRSLPTDTTIELEHVSDIDPLSPCSHSPDTDAGMLTDVSHSYRESFTKLFSKNA